MSTVAAINITRDGATVVTARAASAERITLLDMQSIDFDTLAALSADSDDLQSSSEVAEDDGEAGSPEVSAAVASAAPKLSDFFGYEIDSSIALYSADAVLYQDVSLPFSDQKRVDQVAPLQLQDGLPFDVDEFIVDNQVHGLNQDGSYNVISAMLPSSAISESLGSLQLVGAEPRLISSGASILFSLVSRLRAVDRAPWGDGLNAAIEVCDRRVSIVLFRGDTLLRLREFSFPGNAEVAAELLCASIRSTLFGEEYHREERIDSIHFIGADDVRQFLEQGLERPIHPIDVTPLLQDGADLAPAHELSWALGLLSNEIFGAPNDKKPIDFRKGPFAYKHALKTVWLAVEPEVLYIGFFVFWLLTWCFSTFYNANQSLAAVEEEIQNLVRTKVTGEVLPRGAEVSTLESRVSELEEQLRGMGSLSSLSPLDSLKLLSDVIKQNIDVEVDSLSIAQSRLIFRGTILDTPTLGRLDGALEKIGEPFCATKVDPKGRDPRTSRVKFAAEIELCE